MELNIGKRVRWEENMLQRLKKTKQNVMLRKLTKVGYFNSDPIGDNTYLGN